MKKLATLALGALLIPLVALIVGIVSVGASPYPVAPGTDPREPANCPGGYGTGPTGAVTWCRFHGVHVVPQSGVGERWAGSYAILVGGQVFYGWCLNDAGTHPQVTYPVGTMEDGVQLVGDLHGAAAHPELIGAIPVAMGLIDDGTFAQPMVVPGFATPWSADVLSAAMWALQHYVVGDRSAAGTVVVADVHGWSGDQAVDQASAELLAYATGHQHLVVGVQHDPPSADGTVAFHVLERTDGGPLDASITAATVVTADNLMWRSGAPIATGTALSGATTGPDEAVGDGTIDLQLRLIDTTLPGRLEVSRTWAEGTRGRGSPSAVASRTRRCT